MVYRNYNFSEPQLPPQQSLTISEIRDDEEENLHHHGFEQSVKSSLSSENDSNNGDSDGSSSNDSIRNCRKDLKSAKCFTSGKAVQYRIEDSCKFSVFLLNHTGILHVQFIILVIQIM